MNSYNIYTETKRRERLTFKTMATANAAEAAAAAGETLIATTSAKAADIKEERLRGLSAPARRVAFADAAAAPGEVLNATTSAKAADINEGCLRGISSPEGRVAFEGGGIGIHRGYINSTVAM